MEEAGSIPSPMSLCQVDFRIRRLRKQDGLDSLGRGRKVGSANQSLTLAEEVGSEEWQT